MLGLVTVGASVTMTAKEVDSLCGSDIRLVTCPNGRIIGGMGQVGFVEHCNASDLNTLVAEINSKREQLKALAIAKPTELYSFVKI